MVKFSDGGPGFEGRAHRATQAQLQVREDDQKAVKAKQDRKRATRQKIVIGGALMAMADGGDATAQRLLDQIKAGLPPRDLVAFKAVKA